MQNARVESLSTPSEELLQVFFRPKHNLARFMLPRLWAIYDLYWTEKDGIKFVFKFPPDSVLGHDLLLGMLRDFPNAIDVCRKGA